MSELYRIALTGAPKAGKTTTLNYLAEHASDWIEFAPEPATLLLAGGYPAPSAEHPWTPEWQKGLQIAVAGVQKALEMTADERAKESGKKIVVYDRGLIDGAAFLPGGIKELEEITGLKEPAMLARYNKVIHLASNLPAVNVEHGGDNPHRFHNSDESKELEAKTLQVWQNYPNRQIVTDNQRHRGEIVLELIKNELA